MYEYTMKNCPIEDFSCPYFSHGFCFMDNPEEECEDMMITDDWDMDLFVDDEYPS